MSTIPHPRHPFHDQLSHPSWCAPALCELVGRDVVHQEVPELFVTEAGDSVAVSRLRDDELDERGGQATFPHEVVLRGDDGATVLTLSLADVPRFCSWVLSHGRTAM